MSRYLTLHPCGCITKPTALGYSTIVVYHCGRHEGLPRARQASQCNLCGRADRETQP